MGWSRRARGTWLLPALLMGCDAQAEAAHVGLVGPMPTVTATAPPSPGLRAPRRADTAPGLAKLPVPGFHDAWTSLPEGAVGPRPVVLALHGSGGNAYAACRNARGLFENRGFVLCPYGVPHPHGGETYSDFGAFSREALAGLDALRETHGELADTRGVIVVGWSLGASLGATLAVQKPEAFPRLLLVEGGNRFWTASSATRYRDHTGARVLFACGSDGCKRGVERASALMTKQALPHRVHIGTGGHYIWIDQQALGDALTWLLEGDPRWASSEPTDP